MLLFFATSDTITKGLSCSWRPQQNFFLAKFKHQSLFLSLEVLNVRLPAAISEAFNSLLWLSF